VAHDRTKNALTLGYAFGGFSFTNDAGEANPADNLRRFQLPVPGGKGTVTGKVFVDTKGTFDSNQPGLAGAKVTIAGGDGKVAGTATTDGTATSGSPTVQAAPTPWPSQLEDRGRGRPHHPSR